MDVKQRLQRAAASLEKARRFPGSGASISGVEEAIEHLIAAVEEIAEHSSIPVDPPEEVGLP